MPATDNLVGPRKLEIEEQFSSRYGAHQCHFETNDGIWKFFFDQLAESIRQNNNAESATGHIKLIAVQFRSRREFSASQLILRRRRSTSIERAGLCAVCDIPEARQAPLIKGAIVKNRWSTNALANIKAHFSMCHLCKSLHGVMRAIHIVHRDFLCPEAIIALKEEVTPRIMFSKEHS
uniref:HNH endonuclease n=1 Tax=Ascaris lumbricoides TaxID=6252 RepID=A0A0M3IHF3_ASCLU